jgi:hypothetical protein
MLDQAIELFLLNPNARRSAARRNLGGNFFDAASLRELKVQRVGWHILTALTDIENLVRHVKSPEVLRFRLLSILSGG